MHDRRAWNGSEHPLPGRNPYWTAEKYAASRRAWVSLLLTMRVTTFRGASRREMGRELENVWAPGLGMSISMAQSYWLGRAAHRRQRLERSVRAVMAAGGQ